MKNRHNHYHHSEIEITEKRAPTDESVTLLNEFQDKAMKNIVFSAKIKSNILNAIVIAYEHPSTTSFLSDTIKFYLKFHLNNEEQIIEGELDREEFYEAKRDDEMISHGSNKYSKYLLELITKRYSEAIAKVLIKQLPTDALTIRH